MSRIGGPGLQQTLDLEDQSSKPCQIPPAPIPLPRGEEMKCDRSFPTLGGSSKHLQVHYRPGNVGKWPCPEAELRQRDETFSKESMAQRHRGAITRLAKLLVRNR
jgi:hypothetical protein